MTSSHGREIFLESPAHDTEASPIERSNIIGGLKYLPSTVAVIENQMWELSVTVVIKKNTIQIETSLV